MDRSISTSPQRLRNLLRGGAVHPNTRAYLMEDAFTSLGMRVKEVNVQMNPANGTAVFNVTGWHADGTPFAFRSQPFHGDPVARAKLAAEHLVDAHTGQPSTTTERTAAMDIAQTDTSTTAQAADQAAAPAATTTIPPAVTLIQAAPAAALATPVAEPAQPSGAAVAAVDTHAPAQPGDLKSAISRMRAHRAELTKEVLDMESKLTTAMQGAKDYIAGEKAVVQEFLNEVNQLTNGGPTS
ncbi:hypothetical protein BRDID11004_47900 [Bradyrhizobium diazoefficiens]|uniref:Uncharacterized protein n=1 Tax=Bradyrhizobium diazoefficiens TaxID=1355477 RepID=A0A809ZVW2_9BRAD|nr:hypothetical protein [Bradyrhizobium diazoefficiens]BBZ94307.1 hypothetical protein F07S3_41400 [Bradyrhizobium diazoefficiens]BCE56395.1 hypothetical protein XF5B_39070 [Bradyrhizobium diazoefficiens]